MWREILSCLIVYMMTPTQEMKHLDTCMIWNKLTNIQANLNDKTMYLWCTLYLETSYLQYLNYNRTAKFSWDFSRTWLISESLPGLINGRENGLQWETRWLTQPLELTADRSLLGQLVFQQVLLNLRHALVPWNASLLSLKLRNFGKMWTTCNKVPQFQA